MRHPSAENTFTISPGILALTATLEPIYINNEAQEINRLLTGSRTVLEPGSMPREVLELCEEILKRLKGPRDGNDVEQVHVRRMAGIGRAVLLQGFSIPATNGGVSPLIIVLMEELSLEAVAEVREAQGRFNLTDREMHVAEHLARGLTNKEIALTLSITEQTVKQHLKHMMVKTHATTRTGVLAQLLGSSRQPRSVGPQSSSLRQVS
jgi:DNA-binding CsgD family transcriptional regulator